MGKSKSKKQANEKKKLKSDYSGRIINNREVILTDEAEEYLKKMGYKVIKPEYTALVMTLATTFLILGGFILR